MIVKNYNNTYHTTIKATPKQVKDGKKKNMQVRISISSSFDVGDLVRIKRVKKIFDKGDAIMYSKQVYVVNRVVKNRYELRDVDFHKENPNVDLDGDGNPKSRLYKNEELKLVEEIAEYEPDSGLTYQTQSPPRETRETMEIRTQPVRRTKPFHRFTIKATEKKKMGKFKKKFDPSARNIYEVEKIKGVRRRRGKTEYLIKWKHYPESENTWEAEKNIPEKLIGLYLRKHK
jgi:hypothetical protein